MPRLPPKSSLFPYTTLFRSSAMTTDVYKYKLSEKAGTHTIWILLEDEPGPFNEWEEGKPISNCLIIGGGRLGTDGAGQHCRTPDRKSTRLNSSHMSISYAVF